MSTFVQYMHNMVVNLSREEATAFKCLKLIQQYSWLLNAFVLDFYTENHWETLPPSWKEVLSQISLEELGSWMSMSEGTSQRVWPLSLLSLRASVVALSLPRKQIEFFSESVGKESTVPLSKRDVKAGQETHCLTHEKLQQLFVRHVKPKKRHETVVMAKICADAAVESKLNCVVDIGGGKGHLSRLLSYGYGLRVICVEAQSKLISAAREIDEQIRYTASKYLEESYIQKLPSPEYAEMTVNRSSTSLQLFKDIVFGGLSECSDSNLSIGIVGLHPCGDLAATLLHLFGTLEEAKFICMASCCYMKLNFSPSHELRSYPLSNFFKELPEELTGLAYESLEVSCHALEAYCQRLQKQQYKVLKIHCFRAVLEKLITKYRPDMKHTGLRSVKHFDAMDFPTYAYKALDRINLLVPESDLTCPETLRNLDHWEDVVRLYSLRLLLAPLVETVIILDRLLFIRELGGVGFVIPGFDPVLSPRNLILKGSKKHVKKL